MTYVSPARMQSHSKQQKCLRCQFWPSACVYSLLKISCGTEAGSELLLGSEEPQGVTCLGSHLVAASAARLLAVSVVAATEQLPLLPEVDHVHQQLAAGAAHEAGRVPQPVVAGTLGVDGRVALTHRLLAVVARLEGRRAGY